MAITKTLTTSEANKRLAKIGYSVNDKGTKIRKLKTLIALQNMNTDRNDPYDSLVLRIGESYGASTLRLCLQKDMSSWAIVDYAKLTADKKQIFIAALETEMKLIKGAIKKRKETAKLSKNTQKNDNRKNNTIGTTRSKGIKSVK